MRARFRKRTRPGQAGEGSHPCWPRSCAFRVRILQRYRWRLEVAGLVQDRRTWIRQELAALPQREMIIRHICVEGWDYIGQWSGVPLRALLERVGADLRAKYVAFKTADDYPSSIDMAGAASADLAHDD